jgi:hypothetical protein
MLRAREDEDVEFVVLRRMELPLQLPSIVPSLILFVKAEDCAHLILILTHASTEQRTRKPRIEGFFGSALASVSTARYDIGECKGVSELHAARRRSVGWAKFTECHDIEVLRCIDCVGYLGGDWTPAIAIAHMAAHAAIWKAAYVLTALGFVIALVVATEPLVVEKFSREHGSLSLSSSWSLSSILARRCSAASAFLVEAQKA